MRSSSIWLPEMVSMRLATVAALAASRRIASRFV